MGKLNKELGQKAVKSEVDFFFNSCDDRLVTLDEGF